MGAKDRRPVPEPRRQLPGPGTGSRPAGGRASGLQTLRRALPRALRQATALVRVVTAARRTPSICRCCGSTAGLADMLLKCVQNDLFVKWGRLAPRVGGAWSVRRRCRLGEGHGRRLFQAWWKGRRRHEDGTHERRRKVLNHRNSDGSNGDAQRQSTLAELGR